MTFPPLLSATAMPRSDSNRTQKNSGRKEFLRHARFILWTLFLLLCDMGTATARAEDTAAEGWFVSIQEYSPLYPSLEDARRGVSTPETLSPPQEDDAFLVRERREGWCRILQQHGDGETTEGWIAESALLPLNDYLQDPRYADIVFCPEEHALDYTAALTPSILEHGITLNLDAAHPQARLSGRRIATLGGGGLILEVRDNQGALLWSSPDMGPRMVDTPPPGAFFCGLFGFRWPQQIGDMDGDGKVELLVHNPQTEMGPGSYSLLRWTGTAFKPVFEERQLLLPGLEDAPVWQLRAAGEIPSDPSVPLTWVDGWPHLEQDGVLVAHILRTVPGQGDTVRLFQGQARFRLRPDAGEAHFLGWAVPLAPDME